MIDLKNQYLYNDFVSVYTFNGVITMNILTFSEARAGLKAAMDDVCTDHTPTVITRQGGEPVVMMSLADFNSIEETLYLLGSPKNASRLMASFEQLKAGKSKARELIRYDEQKNKQQKAS